MKEGNETQLIEQINEKIKNAFKNEIVSIEDIEVFEKEMSSMTPGIEAINLPSLISMLKETLNAIEPKTVENLMNEIVSKKIVQKALTSYQKVSRQFNTKCENIIQKLKEIREEAQKQNDIPSIFDIDWIIKTLNEENIYEIDPLVVNNEELNTEDNKNGLDFLMQYSKIEDLKQKTKDFKAVRSNNTRSRTYSSTENKNIIMEGVNSKRRESADVFSTVLSPSVSAKIISLMTRLDYPDFDIFVLDELMNEKASVIIGSEILKRIDLVKSGVIDIPILRNFLVKVVDSYSRQNAIYHNDLHAADVMQTLFTMIMRGDLQAKMKLGDLDKFAMLVGAICHDLKHTGQNNTFHINTRSKIAMRYNDISVLENFHIAQTFKLLSQDQYNILKHFKPEEYRILRRRMIEGIISTDMANHQKVLLNAKGKIEKFNIKEGKNFELIFKVDTDKLFDEQQNILNLCLHCADVSNPAKPSQISKQWTTRVYDEFFKQGDLEKENGLPVSLLCDRKTTNINKAMIGFINFVVVPSFDLLTVLIPEVSFYSENIRINKNYYEMESKASEANSNDEESDNSESSQSD